MEYMRPSPGFSEVPVMQVFVPLEEIPDEVPLLAVLVPYQVGMRCVAGARPVPPDRRAPMAADACRCRSEASGVPAELACCED